MKDQQLADISGDVPGTLNYLQRNDGAEENPVQCGEPGRSVKYIMTISDARPMIQELALDRQGFALMQHTSAVANFYDSDEVRATYYPELQRLVAEVTGAEKVVIFAHDVRCAPKAGVGGVREPVFAVHNDYTLKSGPQHVHDLLPASEAAERLQRHYIELNIWRPIRGPVLDLPLAVCDARSIAHQDLAPVELKHEVYMVSYNSAHRWYYFPLMTPGEVILLKGFDSMTDGRARFTAHTGFRDPRVSADAPARESIEARALAFF
jgi:hypothetical protein